jgi:hypothetical protein
MVRHSIDGGRKAFQGNGVSPQVAVPERKPPAGLDVRAL